MGGLKKGGNHRIIRFPVVFVNFMSACENFPRTWRVKPANQLNKRRFAGAVQAYNRQFLPFMDGQIYIFQSRRFGFRIYKRYVFKPDFKRFSVRGNRDALAVVKFVGDFQKRSVIAELKARVVNGRPTGQNA